MGKRANFKDIAYGLLDSFISRNNSIEGYWAPGKLFALARSQGRPTLTIDLLSEQAAPPEIAEARAVYASWLRRAMRHHALPAERLLYAAVKLEFERNDLQTAARQRGYPDTFPFLCTVHLIDDRHREYVREAIGACWPHDPLKERRGA